MDKITLVLGASENSERYSNRAIKMLRSYEQTVFAIGQRAGHVEDVTIQTGMPDFENVDTVTLYLSYKNQLQYYNYILSLKPKRIIYNPGAENEELESIAEKNGIENLEACTLVLLRTRQF